MNPSEPKQQYCTVTWTVEDIQSLRPHWTSSECEDFLADNEEDMQAMMIQRGWEIIQSFLDDEDEEE